MTFLIVLLSCLGSCRCAYCVYFGGTERRVRIFKFLFFFSSRTLDWWEVFSKAKFSFYSLVHDFQWVPKTDGEANVEFQLFYSLVLTELCKGPFPFSGMNRHSLSSKFLHFSDFFFLLLLSELWFVIWNASLLFSYFISCLFVFVWLIISRFNLRYRWTACISLVSFIISSSFPNKLCATPRTHEITSTYNKRLHENISVSPERRLYKYFQETVCS